MIIIMLGAPATGKGTVAGILNERLGIKPVSSGDIFRECIAEGGALGQKLNEYMTKGELVPDEIVLEMLEERLEKPDVADGVILDGFVRTVVQAEKLKELLSKKGKKVDLVVNLQTPEEEILERIVNRRVCKKCKAVYNTVLNPSKQENVCDKCGGELIQRDDDKLEKAKNRLEVYKRETAPLVDYYGKEGILLPLVLSQAANRMAKEVADDIIAHIEGK